jgi:DNA-binding transcriptional MerR regulator
MLERYLDWQGNLEQLVSTAKEICIDFDLRDGGEISIRMVRDYIQRGILGEVDKAGRELEFTYENLFRLVLARVLLQDGWSLRKIAEHFDFSNLQELEELFPNNENRALSAIKRLRSSVKKSKKINSFISHQEISISKKLARRTSIQQEMKQALRKLGLPEDGPATEEVILLAIAPWFQVLMDKHRFKSLTPKDAEDLGQAVTASLTQLIIKRGEQK